MTQASFLARRTFGQPNYLLLALAAAFVLALIPLGAQRAVQNNTNRPEQWLAGSGGAVEDLAWFRDQFDRGQTVLVSWDGCTLDNSEQLQRLARQLDPRDEQTPEARQRARWFTSAVSAPAAVARLTSGPAGVSEDEAVRRLEGVLIGPSLRRAGKPATRAAGLAVQLSPAAMRTEASLRRALELIPEVAAAECGVDRSTIHMAGAPIESLAIDDASRATLVRLAPLAAAISFAICYWRLGSAALAALAVGIGLAGGLASLAAVFYFGIFEVGVLGFDGPRLGVADALLMTLPVLAYMAALTTTIRLIRRSQRAHIEGPADGAVERAVRATWEPAAMVALALAAALAVWWFSDLAPLSKFGIFAPLSLVIATGIALLAAPVALHRFPSLLAPSMSDAGHHGGMTGWLRGLAGAASANPGVAACGAVLLAIGMAAAMRLQPAVHMPPLLDNDSRLLSEYRWFESRIGNVIPADVVLAIPEERTRDNQTPPEVDGQQYRLSLAERLRLVEAIHERIEALPFVSGALSPATFAADPAAEAESADAEADSALESMFRRPERDFDSNELTGRDLWRISARLPATALDRGAGGIESFVHDIRQAAEPVLLAYQQRDWIVRNLHERGRRLAGAKVGVLFRAPGNAEAPPADAQERLLGELLAESGIAEGAASYFNLASYDKPESSADAEAFRERMTSSLDALDAVVLASVGSDPTAQALLERGLNVVDVSELPELEESIAAPPVESGGPRPIRFIDAGMAPVVLAMDDALAASLRQWASPAAAVLVLGVMMCLRNAAGGIAATAAILLPLSLCWGAMALLGVTLDLGLMLTASIALLISLDATLHYFAEFRRTAGAESDRRRAAAEAARRTAPAAIDALLVVGIGLLPFAASGLASMEQLAFAAVPLSLVAIATTMLVLPSLAAGPLGRYFGAPATVQEARAEAAAPHPAPPAEPAPAKTEAAPGRAQPALAGDQRQDPAEGPHSALHAKLSRLRRSSAGE